MKREIRNPKSHRHTEANAIRTQQSGEPWTVENIGDVWIVRIGTLRIVTSKANAIALRDAHNATLRGRPFDYRKNETRNPKP